MSGVRGFGRAPLAGPADFTYDPAFVLDDFCLFTRSHASTLTLYAQADSYVLRFTLARKAPPGSGPVRVETWWACDGRGPSLSSPFQARVFPRADLMEAQPGLDVLLAELWASDVEAALAPYCDRARAIAAIVRTSERQAAWLEFSYAVKGRNLS